MELGHDKVQGVDYAYTLQGWLKGINGHRLNAAQEMGNDGVVNTDRATIARDVMAYTLGYYQGDYQPIGAGSATAFPMQFSTQPADITGHDLFNGNISHTTVALSKFRNGDPVGYSYRYDQLNRLKQMRRHGLAANTTTWNSSSISDKFKESIVYDGNGNIKTYLRNGANETGMPLAMDNLTYVYNTALDPVSGNPYLVNNRLTQVTDQVANGNYSQALNGTEDLDGQLANNYHYDKIGNLVKDVKENIDRIEWTVYGKIKKITKGNGDIIAYTYDAAGNRASKSVTESSQTTTTWYVRDAQGNSLALYSDKQGGQSGMWWKEQSLYGSSRLGIWAPEINISSVNGTSQWNVAGKTVYELSNHLGNVMATITDKKIGHDPGNGIIDYYNADVTSATDYYPFGMQMPGRNWSSSTYRYGFNGKENDNEVKGTGNQQDYGMRIYDPRIAKFLSEDPLTKDYPWYTPYQFAGNTPMQAIDLDGAEPMKAGKTEAERGIDIEYVAAGREGYKPEEREWRWHAGGLKKAGGQTTKADWYKPGDYENLLSSTNVAAAIAGGFNMYSSAALPSQQGRIDAGVEELQGLIEGGLSDDAAKFFLSAAQTRAARNNTSVSGLTTPSNFNVEDITGAGLILKAGLKALVGNAAKEGAGVVDDAIGVVQKLSKVEKTKNVESIGGKYTKTTEIRPGRGPGQSRAEYVRYRNSDGRVIRTFKDTYDRANIFQHRKSLRGGPEGRPQ